jgi:diguanylate cyclase (GGDEF)-like protein
MPRLRSCLSTPLLSDDQLVGVLTLYSATTESFNEDHRRIIEVVARQIAHTFKRAAEFDGSTRRDPLTGLPNLSQLEHLVGSAGSEDVARASTLTLLFIDVVELKQINAQHGRSAGDEVLRQIVGHARSGLRMTDILFRYGSHEFVALLEATDLDAGNAVALRILHTIREHPVVIRHDRAIAVEVTVTCVFAPGDGESLQDLMAAARSRSRSRPAREGARIH